MRRLLFLRLFQLQKNFRAWSIGKLGGIISENGNRCKRNLVPDVLKDIYLAIKKIVQSTLNRNNSLFIELT